MDPKLKEQIDLWTDQDEYEKIITALNAILEEGPDYDASSELGRALNNMGDYQRGLETLLSIKEQGKDDYMWHYRMSYSYLGLEDPKEALHAIATATELNPDYFWGWYQRGECLYALSDFPAALKAYQKAYQLQPEDWLGDLVSRIKRMAQRSRSSRPML